jgi:hypothetical protein
MASWLIFVSYVKKRAQKDGDSRFLIRSPYEAIFLSYEKTIPCIRDQRFEGCGNGVMSITAN